MQPDRIMSSLSTKHQKELDKFMVRIKEFVYDSQSSDREKFDIPNKSLQKALQKEVTKVYMGTGLFTEYDKKNPETTIKKSKAFKQSQFIKGYPQSKALAKSEDDLGFGFVDE